MNGFVSNSPRLDTKPQINARSASKNRLKECAMKRDMDLVRDLLLKIEDREQSNTDDLLECANNNKAVLAYHLNMLVKEADLLRGKDHFDDDGQYWIMMELTWDGHEFLTNVRDPEIWRKTSEAATKIGSFSIETLGELAKGFIKTKIQQHTGVAIG